MPSPGRVDASQRAIIQTLLETDADLHAAARAMTIRALRTLDDLLQRGDPATKARLAIAFAAPVVSAISEPVAPDEFGELREEMTQLIADVREAIVPADVEAPPTV